MRHTLTAPARINLLGNPSDANEGDFATVSVAIEVRAGVTLEPADGLILEATGGADPGASRVRLEFRGDEYPLAYDGQLDLLKGAVNRLFGFSGEFRSKLARNGVRITT